MRSNYALFEECPHMNLGNSCWFTVTYVRNSIETCWIEMYPGHAQFDASSFKCSVWKMSGININMSQNSTNSEEERRSMFPSTRAFVRLSRLVQCQRALAMNSTVLVYVRRAWNEHDTEELYCVGNGHKVKSATIEFNDKFKMTSDRMGATIWMSSHNKWKQKEKSEMDIRHLLNQFYKLRMLFHRKANVVLQLALTLLSYKFFVQLFLLFLKRKNAFQLNEKRFFVTAKSWFQFLWVKWDNNFFLLATIFLWWFCCVANIGYVSKKFSIEFSSSATFYSLSFILVNLNNAFHVFS